MLANEARMREGRNGGRYPRRATGVHDGRAGGGSDPADQRDRPCASQ